MLEHSLILNLVARKGSPGPFHTCLLISHHYIKKKLDLALIKRSRGK